MELPQKFCISVRYDLANLVRKLRPDYPVHRWLTRYIETGEGSSEDLIHALEITDGSAWADRAVAYHILGLIDLTPPERRQARHLVLKALAPLTQSDASFRRIRRSLWLAFLGWNLPWTLVVGLLSGLFGADDLLLQTWILIPVLTVLTAPFLYAGMSLRDQGQVNTVQRAAATALSRVGNPVCIVILSRFVQRLSLPPPPIREEAIQALRAILPMVTSDWYGRLPTRTCEVLLDLVGWFDEDTELDDLALETLDALERVGDGECIKPVEFLAARAIADSVSERAAAILPALIARRDREIAATTLLRPSANNRAEHLVRPVYGADPDVTNLLRASHPESPPSFEEADNA